jgi:spermidine/putrescine transport system permease protein
MKPFSHSYVMRFCQWVSGVGLFLMYIPLFFLVLGSFSSDYGCCIPTSLSLQWYEKLALNHEAMRSLQTSCWIAFLNTLGSTVLGTLTALGLSHFKSKMQTILRSLMAIPLLMPEIVLGLSLLIWFSLLHFTLGFWSLLASHVTFSLSYVILIVLAGLSSQDYSLVEAAKGLGANGWVIFWEITFPDLRAYILSGAIIACTLSFDDFLISFFTAGVGCNTLPVHLYSVIRLGITPEINALSAILFFGTALLVLAFLVSFSHRMGFIVRKKEDAAR